MLLLLSALVANLSLGLSYTTQKVSENSNPVRIITSRNCMCIETPWEPVCAQNGKTYKSKADVECDNSRVSHAGPCCNVESGNCSGRYVSALVPGLCTLNETTDLQLPDIGCLRNQIPKTGMVMDLTYNWAVCWSKRSGEARCLCDNTPDPVCGADGQTYFSECEAVCWSVEVAHDGPCSPCGCPRGVRQVCGGDGVTYTNICLARCAGTKVVSGGPCPMAGRISNSSQGCPITVFLIIVHRLILAFKL